MQCFLKRYKRFLSVGFLTVCHPLAFALDESRLWLARSHQIHYLPLVHSAQAAEAISRCTEVMEGTLDLDQSRPGHPIFRILCRQPDGRSYNEMVDGLSFETLTTPKPIEVALTPEEEARIKREEEAKRQEAIAQRKLMLWKMCEVQLQARTKMMLNLTWLHEGHPEPIEFSEQDAVFEVDFDAKSIWGVELKYQARCEVNDEAVTATQLTKR